MSKKSIYSRVLEEVIDLYQRYSNEHRASTQPFHLEKVRKKIKNYKYRYDDLLIREPLIEHIGSLPIVATTIFPHIGDFQVDLGKALIMLAIHDIGELVTGDEMVFTKNKKSSDEEKTGALALLSEQYHSLYLEMETRANPTAMFAKAIDKLTPDVVDLITPAEVTIERYRKSTGKNPSEIVPMIKKFKHPYMTWNSFLTGLHLELLDRLERKLKLA